MQISSIWSKWPWQAWLVATLLVMPLLFLIATALQGSSDVFEHLWQTVLWDYSLNTVLLIVGVLLVSSILALPLAWLVAYCEFPGRRHFSWALMLPLAMPSYVIAYIYTDLLDYAGPVQVWLRAQFGWQSPDDYWFIDLRTLSGATLMLALVLYPYLFLIFKTALREQSFKLLQAAQVMGHSPMASFFSVSLPLARGAIVAGLALIAMETMADFATVHYFAVNTLTTAVYDTWLGYYSLPAAAKISALMLLLLFSLMALERVSRAGKVEHERQAVRNEGQLYWLCGTKAWLATGWAIMVLMLAFILPVLVLADYALTYWQDAWQDEFARFAWQSLQVAMWVSAICVVLSTLLGFWQRFSTAPGSRLPARLASTGYALPGTVLAVAVLLPLTALDNTLNEWFDGSQWQPGLLFSGTIFALIFAYVVRFFAVAQGAIEASYGKISPSQDMASFSLGKGPWRTFWRVHVPLLRRGMLTAALLVFIESMKELPAALLLRPFNFETLATHVYQYVSDEQLELAAFSALLIVLVGLLPLYIINRSMESAGGKLRD
ncbi:ABC transporter permease [Pseudoalteromonas fenneropenaei]|uniref:ABC transporter permease n=1 Tax=Pseudoalteromonas fenneropenaei TaxID=1737459 RepID=A0ABV7CHG5_9GAMM